MEIADLLPMLPWEGPPLPRFLGVVWPQLPGRESGLFLPTPEASNIATPGTYNNEETWDIEWEERPGSSEDEVVYLPATIRIHRHANRS